MAATRTTTRADVEEALRHATAAPQRDWAWIDKLLEQWLEVRA